MSHRVSGLEVIVDGRVIDHPTAGGRGVGRYSIGFVRSLIAAEVSVTVMCSTIAQEREWSLEIEGCRTVAMSRAMLRSVVDSSENSWFLCTQLMLHPVPLDPVPRMVTEAGLPVAAIVYDVIPQRYPHRYLSEPSAAVQARLRTITARSADLLLAISTFTRDTASIELGIEPERFTIVGSPIEPRFCVGPVDARVLSSFGLSDGVEFVISVTGADPRKNTERLIRAWARLSPDDRDGRRLVIACAAPDSVLLHWNHIAHVEGVQDSVILTGTVTDDEMVSLLRAATLSVLPSIEEGFGLPIVESVNCGTPALCSSTSSMPEVAGSSLGLFDPHDVGDIARAISSGLGSARLRSQLLAEQVGAANRWTIEAVGEAAKKALEATKPRWAAPNRLPPGSVAIAAPGPTSMSAIGGYTTEIMEAWQSDPRPVWLDDVSCSADRHFGTGTGGVVGVGSLHRRIRLHDVEHLIAVLGSSEFHAVTADRVRAGGAHLWIHEPTILGAVLGPAFCGGGERWFRERAGSFGQPLTAGDPMEADVLHARGVTFLAEILGAARSLIVSSGKAARRLHEIAAVELLPPLLVLPHAYPHRLRADLSPERIVTFGWVEPSKQIDRLIRALADLPGRRLDVIGGGSAHVVQDLRDLTSDLGLDQRVTLHGRVDDELLERLLGSAGLGVQLRRDDLGQNSGAVAELISRGIPVVTDLSAYEGQGGVFSVKSGLPASDLASTIEDLLRHESLLAASDAAIATAGSWRPAHVAAALSEWLDRVDQLDVGTVEIAGPR